MARQTASKTEKLAAKKAIDDALAREKLMEEAEEEDFSFEDHDSEGNEVNQDEDDELLIDESVKAAAFDIFDEGDRLTKAGIPIRYWIKRNGSFICEKYPPYSFNELQKEFKGGQYHVVAKELSTNRIKKSQVMSLGDPLKSDDREERETFRHVPEPTPQAAQPSFMELFSLMNKMSEDKAREAREQASNKNSESNNFMMAFLEMNKSASIQAQAQQAQTQAMMLEIAKMNQTVSEKLAESQAKMFEKMESRFEKIIEVVQAKDNHKEKPLDPMVLFKMMNDSKTEGFELFSKISELAQEKADEKIALMDDRGSASKEPRLSMTDRLIEGILPTIATALVTRTAAPEPQPVQTQRRVLPKPQANGNVQPVARNTQAQNAASSQQQKAGNQGKGGVSRTASGGNTRVIAKNSSGLSKVDFGAQKAVETVKPEVVAPTEDEIKAKTAAFKAFVTEKLAPTLGECLMNTVEPSIGAERCEETLKLSNISLNTFLKNVSNDDMLEIVETFGLPNEAKAWFNDLYANIKIRAGMGVGGESN